MTQEEQIQKLERQLAYQKSERKKEKNRFAKEKKLLNNRIKGLHIAMSSEDHYWKEKYNLLLEDFNNVFDELESRDDS
jgi:hypothetical protein